MRIPTYEDVLKEAEFWRRTNEKGDLERAANILRNGMNIHQYALPLGDELVLVLEKLDRDQEALRQLKELESRFKEAGEETLCRFGKIYKKRAEHFAANPAAAYPNLEESERYYGLAYEKSFGFYPRVNELAVRFMRASVAKALDHADDAALLLRDVREKTAHMLGDPTLWPQRKDDDHIWIPATQGEAKLLLGHWLDAELSYREAVRQADGQQFYLECMREQVKMLMAACRSLGFEPAGALADPDSFFHRNGP